MSGNGQANRLHAVALATAGLGVLVAMFMFRNGRRQQQQVGSPLARACGQYRQLL